jgi:hypothetical protein
VTSAAVAAAAAHFTAIAETSTTVTSQASGQARSRHAERSSHSLITANSLGLAHSQISRTPSRSTSAVHHDRASIAAPDFLDGDDMAA